MLPQKDDFIAVVIANQSWVSLDNQTDYALLDLDADGECWARKLIRKIVDWGFFNRVIILCEDDSSHDVYSKICSEEGVDFKLVPKNLYQWPKIWYPWAWNFENRGATEIILAWVYWLQKALNPATYFVLNITGGFVRKEHMSRALNSYRPGHRAALENNLGSCGYIVDSAYLNTVYSSNYQEMALLADFKDSEHLEQTISEHGNRLASFQSRTKIPMGLWSKRHFHLLQNYCKSNPEESYTLELNSVMFDFLEKNYFLHQANWLNLIEITFSGEQSEWLCFEHLVEINKQAARYGRTTFILNFSDVDFTESAFSLIDAISKSLFLAVKIPANSSILLIKSLLARVDYLELTVPANINYLNCESFEDQLFYKNWVYIYEESSRNQKPCFGLRVNIPKDSNQSVAMLEYFKNKVDFNPCMISERIQGDGYPRTPNIKFINNLSRNFEDSLKSKLGVLSLNHQGRGVVSKTVYELPIDEQLKLITSNDVS